MSKKIIIFNILFLVIFVTFCGLNILRITTNVEVDDDKPDTNNDVSLNLKSSYAVTERWNDTTAGIIEHIAVSSDGRYMVVGGTAGPGPDLFFYNTTDHIGDPMWTYDGSVTWDSIAISADGEYIVAVNGDGPGQQAILFNKTLPDPGNNKIPVWRVDPFIGANSVDISADGKYIVVGGSNEVRVYNNSYRPGFDKTLEYEWTNATGDNVQDIAISSDGNYVVCGADLGVGIDNIIFWNNTEYDYNQVHLPMWSYNTSTDINSVAISFKGDYIVAGGDVQAVGDELFVFNKSADDGKPEWSHSFTNINVLSVAISEANGEYIAVGGHWTVDSGKVFLFNRSDYKGQPMWESHTNSDAGSVAITADGEYIVAGTQYNLGFVDHLYLFNKSAEGVKSPEWSFEMDYHINSVSISSWGNYIAAGGTYAGGTGKAHLFYHARPIPRIISSNGDDDDDDDDEEGAIPFGNHYLLFAAIAIASLVIITKRKAVFSKK